MRWYVFLMMLAWTLLQAPLAPAQVLSLASDEEAGDLRHDYYDITFSPDGRRAATYNDRSITTWDVATWTPVTRWEALPTRGAVYGSVAWSPDGMQLLATTRLEDRNSYKAALFDPETGRLLRTLGVGYGPVAFSPTGRHAAYRGNNNNEVTLYDLETGKTKSLHPQTNAQSKHLAQLLFSQDGGRLVVICKSAPNSLTVWDTTKGELVWSSRALLEGIERAALSPDGSRLAVCEPNSLRVLDTIRWQVVKTLIRQRHEDVAFSPDGKLLASLVGYSSGIQLWHAESGQAVGTLKGYNARSIAFTPNGQAIASVYGTAGIVLWDWPALLRVLKPARTFKIPGEHEYNVRARWSPDGSAIATISRQNNATVRLWDARTMDFRGTLSATTHDGERARDYRNFFFLHRGKTIACLTYNTIGFWQVEGLKVRSVMKTDQPTLLAESADGRRMALANSKDVRVFDLATGKMVAHFEVEKTSGLCFSPDGQTIALGFSLWDLTTGEERMRSDQWSQKKYHTTRFTPDGRFLIGLQSSVPHVWDLETGEVTSPCPLHNVARDVSSIALSPDGRLLATGSEDNLVRIWRFPTPRLLATFQGHEGEVHCVDFSPDGQTLISAGADSTVRNWDLSQIQVPDGEDPSSEIAPSQDLPTSAVYRSQNGAEVRISFDRPATRQEMVHALSEIAERIERERP